LILPACKWLAPFIADVLNNFSRPKLRPKPNHWDRHQDQYIGLQTDRDGDFVFHRSQEWHSGLETEQDRDSRPGSSRHRAYSIHFILNWLTATLNDSFVQWLTDTVNPSAHGNKINFLFIEYNRQMTHRSLTCHTAKSQCLTQKTVKYTNLLKRQPIQNYSKYFQLTKNVILANINTNDKRGQERKRGF